MIAVCPVSCVKKQIIFMAILLGSSFRYFITHRRIPMRDRYFKRSNGQWRVRYLFMGYTGLSTALCFTALSFLPLESLPSITNTVPETALVRTRDIQPLPNSSTLIDNRNTHTTIPTTPIIPAIKPPVPMVTVLSLFSDTDAQVMHHMGATAAKIASAAILSTANKSPNAAKNDTHLNPDAQEQPIPENTQSSNVIMGQGKNLTIAAGDTLSTLLVRAGLSEDDTDRAIRAIRPHVRPSDLRPGQTLSLELSTPNAPYQFHRLSLAVDPVKSIEVKRGWGGLMTAAIIEKPLKNDFGAHVAVVKSSLYGSAAAAGVPNAIIAEAIKALGHQIDFQRDIHPGDKLEIMYDRRITSDGYVAKTGNLVYARLHADGRELTIYRHDFKDGRVEYFDEKGRSIRKTLLRTPMDGARVTSGFGMRMHPIMGYSKMHKGVDFGAPIGTPIYAAGDGIIEKAARLGAYGNYIKIKHNSKLSTAYAHLSRYGGGIKTGIRVRQGQIIGYVGTTGRSTGPHLHYEVLVNGNQMNPQSVKLPTSVVLEGKDLTAFKNRVDQMKREFRDRINGMEYAAINQSTIQ